MYFVFYLNFTSTFCSPGKSIGASSVLLGLVLVGRAAFVFPLSFLINLSKKSYSEKIEFKQQVSGFVFGSRFQPSEILCGMKTEIHITIQVTIWWAGLMRGAVSMALAYNKVNLPKCYLYGGC